MTSPKGSKTRLSPVRGIPKNDLRRKLHKGDEVTWTDPDAGLCSRTGFIMVIDYRCDDTAGITWEDGDHTEVFLHELS